MYTEKLYCVLFNGGVHEVLYMKYTNGGVHEIYFMHEVLIFLSQNNETK